MACSEFDSVAIIIMFVELRKAVRSSATSQSRTHEHLFSEEIYCPETDMWTKTCEDCGHKITYEKM